MDKASHIASQKAHYISMLTLFALPLLLQLFLLHSGHNWGGDFSQYIAQAKSIIEGNIETQIKNNTFIISHCDGVYGPYIYPWGYPLLLAPMYALFGFNLLALKLVNIVLFSIFSLVFYCFCLRYMSYKYAFITALFFTLNPLFLNFANNLMSDIPFLFFSFLAFFFLSKLFSTKALESHLDSSFVANGGGVE